MQKITFVGTTPPSLEARALPISPNNCPIYVPASCVDTYKSASGWSGYASRVVAIPE